MHNKALIAASNKKGLDHIVCNLLDICFEVNVISEYNELCSELNKKEYQLLILFTSGWELNFILKLAKQAKELSPNIMFMIQPDAERELIIEDALYAIGIDEIVKPESDKFIDHVFIAMMENISLPNEDYSILVSNDFGRACDVVSYFLNKYGFLCDISLTAEDTLDKALSNKYDLYIVNLRYADDNNYSSSMQGEELIATLKNLNHSTPLMVISAADFPRKIIECLKLGADYFISSKNIMSPELVYAVKELLYLSEKNSIE